MIEAEVLGAEGRVVKCTRCENTWLGKLPDQSEEPDPFDTAPAPEEPPEPSEAATEAATEEATEAATEEVTEAATEEAADETVEEASDEVSVPDEPDEEDEPELDEAPEQESEPEPDPFDAVAERRARRGRVGASAGGGKKRSRAGAVMWTLLVVTVIGVLGAGYALRDMVIQLWPAAEQIYKMAGLEREPPGLGFAIRNVVSKSSSKDGKKLLTIKGEVANISKDVRQVPKMRGILLDKNKRVLQEWSFSAPESKLLPGENVTFTTELKNPAPGAAELTVTFVDRK